ncbi:MAG: biotin transporter BioY [Coriobacteriales bacterium]|nr:biotin transporter BioY [Coriobacteriales bacterium]
MAALGIALLAVSAQIQLPIGPIPFTLQTLVLIVIILAFNSGSAMAAVGGYLVLGGIGLPIGAGFKGGIAWLIGPTGGFLLGFLLATLLVVVLRKLWLGLKAGSGFGLADKLQPEPTSKTESGLASKRSMLLVNIVFGVLIIVVYYAFGLLWFMYSTGSTFLAAFTLCLAPFLIPDVIKLVAAVTIAQALYHAMGLRFLERAN